MKRLLPVATRSSAANWRSSRSPIPRSANGSRSPIGTAGSGPVSSSRAAWSPATDARSRDDAMRWRTRRRRQRAAARDRRTSQGVATREPRSPRRTPPPCARISFHTGRGSKSGTRPAGAARASTRRLGGARPELGREDRVEADRRMQRDLGVDSRDASRVTCRSSTGTSRETPWSVHAAVATTSAALAMPVLSRTSSAISHAARARRSASGCASWSRMSADDEGGAPREELGEPARGAPRSGRRWARRRPRRRAGARPGRGRATVRATPRARPRRARARCSPPLP